MPRWTALLIVVLALPAAAQMGKWVDAEGRIHYGDQPPQTLIRELPMAKGAVSLSSSAAMRSYANASASKGGASGGGGTVISGSAAKPVPKKVIRYSCGKVVEVP